jgi:hypothetical protein
MISLLCKGGIPPFKVAIPPFLPQRGPPSLLSAKAPAHLEGMTEGAILLAILGVGIVGTICLEPLTRLVDRLLGRN